MHHPEPTEVQEERDQAEFDAAVARDGKIVLAWLGGIGVLGALLLSTLALVKGSEHDTITITSGTAAPAPGTAVAATGAQLPPKTISLKIVPEGRPGPDGKKHDYMTQTEFAVRVGQTVNLVIDNRDEGEHSITSPQIGVAINIKPGVHTYQMVVREKGRFSWFCLIPCDSNANGWAMEQAGYMRGFITAA
jgi:hypothetical protein